MAAQVKSFKDMTDNLNGYAGTVRNALDNSGLGLTIRHKVTNAMDAAQAAVSDCTQVGAPVALIRATPAGSRVDKMQIAQAAIQRAQDAADTALADLAAVAESVR